MFRTRCEHPKRGLALQLADIQPEPSQHEGDGDQADAKANSAMIALDHRVLSGFQICGGDLHSHLNVLIDQSGWKL